MSTLGKPTSRVDGRLKVTGAARYAAEFTDAALVYGVVVGAEIAHGRIVAIDSTRALAATGVLAVLTHENTETPRSRSKKFQDQVAPNGTPLRPLYDDQVMFFGQPIALVLADSFERARHAAGLVGVEYESEPPATDLAAAREQAYAPRRGKLGYEGVPDPRGNADKALRRAAHRVDHEYATAPMHHNPMEMFAATVLVEPDGKLVIHEKTQGIVNDLGYLRGVFELGAEQLRIETPFVGGGFGSGLRPQYQLYLAVLAARTLHRSVRVVLTRQQMFTLGYRPPTIQRVALGADDDGRLRAIVHEVVQATSRFEDYTENTVSWSSMLYQCDDTRLDYRLAALDLMTPIDQRAPGAASGLFALESAMDELAHELHICPLELRLRNYAETDQVLERPFSSKALREVYRVGAERFGWSGRPLAPGSQRRGDLRVGTGMATGVWEAQQGIASAGARLGLDGKLRVASASHDIGPGTYTVMTQIAGDALGLALDQVVFGLGDTRMPPAPLQGGSFTVSTVGSAVAAVCEKLATKLFELAQDIRGAGFERLSRAQVVFQRGELISRDDPDRHLSLVAILRAHGLHDLEVSSTAIPDLKQQKRFSMHSHSATFCEVTVDDALGVITVTRVVAAVAAGRILNPLTARSQVLGAVVWGIGHALEEQSVLDHRYGRFLNHSLAEYHVAVNADVPEIDVIFVEEHDDVVNPLGAKGIGEIGIVGVAAAIANAVFHATGKRVRSLPITLDDLL